MKLAWKQLWLRFLEALSPRIIPVGLEVQDGNLALAAADIAGQTLEVKYFLSQPMHADAIINGRLVNPELFREAVEKLFSALPVSKDKISLNLSLPPKFFYSDILRFPAMEEAALESALRLKLETSLPWKMEEAYIAWEVAEKTAGRVGIFAIAAKKDELLAYIRVFRELDIRVWFMEPHLLSIARALKLLHELKEIMFLNADRDGIEVLCMNQKRIVFRSTYELRPGEWIEEALRRQIILTLPYIAQNLGFRPRQILISDRFLMLESVRKDFQPEKDWPPVSFLDESWQSEKLIAIGAGLFRKQRHSEILNMLPSGEGRYEEELLIESMHFWLKTATVTFATISLILLGVLGIFRLRVGFWQEAAKISSTAAEQLELHRESVKKAAEFNEIVGELQKAWTLRLTLSPLFEEITEVLSRYEGTLERISRRDEGSPFLVVARVPTRQKATELKKALEDSGKFSKVEIPIRDLAQEKDLVLNISLFPK